MNKPITVKYEEFKQKLADVINDCEMPPFMIEPILNEFLIETHNCARQQYLRDKEIYESSSKNTVCSDISKAVDIEGDSHV